MYSSQCQGDNLSEAHTNYSPETSGTNLPKIQDTFQMNSQSDEDASGRVLCHGKKKLMFVTEENSTTAGRFRERMKGIGVESNVGVTTASNRLKQAEINERLSATRTYVEEFSPKPKQLSSRSKSSTSPSPKVWQPLSLTALVEYTQSIPVPCQKKHWNSGSFATG